MSIERLIPLHVITAIIENWQSSIHVEDIGSADEKESIRAFTVQKCIDELKAAVRVCDPGTR